jgi:hypothetical protein
MAFFFYRDTELAGLLFETQMQNLRGVIMQYGSGTNLIQSYGTFQTAYCSIHKYTIPNNMIKKILHVRFIIAGTNL